MVLLIRTGKMPEKCVDCFASAGSRGGGGLFCYLLYNYMEWDEMPEGKREDCPLAELIECKDCKFFERDLESYALGFCRFADYTCKKEEAVRAPDDFCSFAVRREEE